MTDKELNKILKEFETVRVEMLDEGAKRLFYAIMKIADKRDELLKENQRLNDDIKILLKENEAKEKVIIKQNNVLNELEKWLKVNLIDLEKQNASNIYNEGLKQGMLANGRLIQNKLNELKESDK